MQHFCFCCSLSSGAYILGTFDIVWGMFCYAVLGKIDELIDSNVFGTLNLIASIFVAIVALTAGVLIFAASTSDPFYVNPWIIANYILVIFMVIQMIIYLSMDFMPTKYAFIIIAVICLRIYFVQTMKAFRRELANGPEEVQS